MKPTTSLILALAALAATHTEAYPKYSALIPNGEAMGKSLGHSDAGYTPFGTLFKDKGATWAGVCKAQWPGQSVTVGAVLGDPCCTWTSGKADFALSAPFLAGKQCASTAAKPTTSTQPATGAKPATGAQSATGAKPATAAKPTTAAQPATAAKPATATATQPATQPQPPVLVSPAPAQVTPATVAPPPAQQPTTNTVDTPTQYMVTATSDGVTSTVNFTIAGAQDNDAFCD